MEKIYQICLFKQIRFINCKRRLQSSMRFDMMFKEFILASWIGKRCQTVANMMKYSLFVHLKSYLKFTESTMNRPGLHFYVDSKLMVDIENQPERRSLMANSFNEWNVFQSYRIRHTKKKEKARVLEKRSEKKHKSNIRPSKHTKKVKEKWSEWHYDRRKDAMYDC